MTTIAPWEPLYLIQQNTQTTYLLEYPQFKKGTALIVDNIGIQGLKTTGVDKGKFLLPVTNATIFFKPIPETQEIEKSTGESKQDIVEFNQDDTVPTRVRLDFVATPYNLSLFLWLLMQNGASEATNGTATTATFTPYTSSTCEMFVSLVKVLVNKSTSRMNDTSSHMLLGCVCEELTIYGASRDILRATATLVGADWRKYNVLGKISNDPRLQHYPIDSGSTVTVKHNGTAFTGTSTNKTAESLFSASAKLPAGSVEWSSVEGYLNFGNTDLASYDGEDISVHISTQDDQLWSALQEFYTITPLKWEDCTITIDGNTAWLNNFTLTLTNGVTPKFYNHQYAHSFDLGRFKGNGMFNIPWSSPYGGGNDQIDDFLDSTDKSLSLSWGGYSGINDALTIAINLKYTNVEFDETTEFESVCSYTLADDGINNYVNIACTYDTDKLVRGIT